MLRRRDRTRRGLQQRVVAQGRSDVGQILNKILNDAKRRCEVAGEAGRDRGAGCRVDAVEQPQRQFRVVLVLLRRMPKLLHIEVGEDADQGRAHIGAATQPDIGEAGEASEAG